MNIINNYRSVFGSIVLGWLLLTVGARASDHPFLHPLFGDGAVLQRGVPVPMWGWADPGELIQVEFAGQSISTRTDQTGRWSIHLAPMVAEATPRVMTIVRAARVEPVRIENLLVGDVWICSGQSNMQMGLGAVSNGPAEIARADYPMLRLGWVRRAIAWSPLDVPDMDWRVCTPATVAVGDWGTVDKNEGFSAVAYFFGRKLVQDLGIPIGVIQSTWGGTPLEAWTSGEAILHSGAFEEYLAALQEYQAAAASGSASRYHDEWWMSRDPGTVGGWERAELADSGWKLDSAASALDVEGGQVLDGVIWFRREIDVPAEAAGQELTVHLGTVDDSDTAYWDGEKVGGGQVWFTPREYRIPGVKVRAGRHVLALRVLNLGGPGGLEKTPGAQTISWTNRSALKIDISQNWRVKRSATLSELGRIPLGLVDEPSSPSLLFNAMIHPLAPAALTGFVWYQGEANVKDSELYHRLLPAMISDWRSRFQNPRAPFLVTQLANFDPRDSTGQSNWAGIREAQRQAALTLTNCALAVTIDLGEPSNIHPGNKQDVGLRLALAAERLQYDKAVEASGPTVRQARPTPHGAYVEFDHAAGLRTSDGQQPMSFAVQVEDGKWIRATARMEGEGIELTAGQPAHAIRYAWGNCPTVNLVNAASLPAVPFELRMAP